MYQIQSRPIINIKHCQSMYNREVNFIENDVFFSFRGITITSIRWNNMNLKLCYQYCSTKRMHCCTYIVTSQLHQKFEIEDYILRAVMTRSFYAPCAWLGVPLRVHNVQWAPQCTHHNSVYRIPPHFSHPSLLH